MTANPGNQETDVKIRMRLYEGFRGESNHSAKVISSYYLKQLSQEEVFSESAVVKEGETLKRVFNLTGVKLMTQAGMKLKKGRSKTPSQVIVLNGRKLLVQLSGIPGQENRFRVEVFEDAPKPRSLLKSKIILPEKKSTVLGFEDSGGHIYFASFHRSRDIPSEPLPPLPPHPADKPGKAQPKNVKKPKLIRKADPKYPLVALKAKVEGSVVISATTSPDGDVVEAEVLSGHPLLRHAAIKAIKQWKYEPYYVEGTKKPVTFTVVLRFRLPEEKKPKPQDGGPVAISAQHRPKLLKRVEPKYPEKLVEAGIQGKVVIEATTDTNGNVVEAIAIDGHPLLNQLALQATKQWKYAPYVIDGVKKAVKFTVIVKFTLKERGKKPAEKK